jgi:hypothetical protein
MINSIKSLKKQRWSQQPAKKTQERTEEAPEPISIEHRQPRADGRHYTQTKLQIDNTTNLPFGDHINNSEIGENILFHNINGMKDPNNWFQIITSMQEMNIDIFGFAKLNKSLERGYSNKWVQTIRKSYYYSRSIYSESKLRFETSYKPGGTMTTVMGKWQP